MNKDLMTIVLEAAAFWELAGDEIVDPEAAAAQMEGVLSVLQRLTPEEKAELTNFAREYAALEETQGGDAERVRFFRSFPDGLGLSD